MKRRKFTQLLALGAGSLPFLSAGAQDPSADEAGKDNGKPARGTVNQRLAAQAVKVDDFIALAEAKLPKATFDYITTGSADELTLKDNIEAFRRIKVLPPLLRGVDRADMSTTVLGQKISMPIMLAPVAALRMYDPQGALAAARAAESAGTIIATSTSAGNSVEEMAAASKGPKWFQLYVPKDRAVTKKLVQRVERAGYTAIIVTVDLGEWKDADRRNRFMLPKDMLVKHLRDVGHENITDAMSYEDIIAFNAKAWDVSLSWDFFGWLRSITKLPILVKGVMRKDDALKAVKLGLDGIVVSNHGGRRLDGMPASIDVLPEISEAVNGRAEILMDGGIRRGTDVLKALAYGAKAVLIGRPYAWALGAAGEAGVSRVLQLLRDEFENTMISSGCSKVAEIETSLMQVRS